MERILLHHSALPATVDAARLAAWIGTLPPGRAARLERVRDPRARLATVLGIALLLDCARAAGLVPPSPGALVFPERGKPGWPAGRDFSITHAHGLVACALAPSGMEVGLDAEPEGAAAKAVLRLAADEAELAACARAGLTPTDLWTAKEAVVKLTGQGVSAARRVRVTPAVARAGDRDYVLMRPRLANGYCCTLAATERRPVEVIEREAEAVLAALA